MHVNIAFYPKPTPFIKFMLYCVFIPLFCCVTFVASGQVQVTETMSVQGEVRARFESLDGQFRANKSGSDQLLLYRSLLHGKYETNEGIIGIELQDSRTYLSDEGTPLSSSFTNSLDVLQVYAGVKGLPGFLGEDSKQTIKLGRQTISIGSKRQIERVSFANVIKSYTGIYSATETNKGDELHAFYVVPIERRPSDSLPLQDNQQKLDKEQWHRRMWGIHYRHRNSWPELAQNIWIEGFFYGLDETDHKQQLTANRHYLTSGFRLYRPWAEAKWDFDIEAAHRSGHRHQSHAEDDVQDLTVDADMLLFRLGYTFAGKWRPNVAFQTYYTSGDSIPNDNKFEQFERLFGGRRTDLNNTSIHGPLTPANLTAVGMRVTLNPEANWDARLHYSAAKLSSATDGFVVAKLRDPSGASGDEIGHTLDTRFRYWWLDKALTFELGVSWLFAGDYLEKTRAKQGLETESTTFGYVQLAYGF